MDAHGRTKLAVQLQQSAVDQAIQMASWPGDYDVAEAASVVAELRAEALTAGAEDLPMSFWAARLEKKFSRRKR